MNQSDDEVLGVTNLPEKPKIYYKNVISVF
jgi:hypothetical protein